LLISDTIQDGLYSTYYIIDGNCPSVDTLNFTILPKPDISISFSQLLPCIGYQLDVVNSSNNISNEDFSWYINDSLYYQNFSEPYFNLDTGFYKIKVKLEINLIVSLKRFCMILFLFMTLLDLLNLKLLDRQL